MTSKKVGITVVFVSITFLISGCNSSSSNDNNSDDGGTDNDGQGNNNNGAPNDYLDVGGVYSFSTNPVDFQCTDGAEGTNPPLSLNFIVHQEGNQIELRNKAFDDGGVTPGFEIIESTQLEGNLGRNSTFIANQSATAIIDGIPGESTVNYTVSGEFTGSGWAGDYSYSVFAQDLFVTCNFNTKFEGEKTTASNSPMVTPYEYNYPLDVYDRFNVIGGFGGGVLAQ